jgi:hypothetical protein
MRARATLFAILLYVTLDLSVPMIPGAFVFAPDDSVDGIQGHRGRAVTEVVLGRAPAGDTVMRPLPRIDPGDRGMSTRPIALPVCTVVSRLPRATLIAVPPSEDPHEPLLRLQ